MRNHRDALKIIAVCSICLILTGCVPLLVGGGAAAGYGIAKDAEDGKIIDSK